MAAPSSAPQFRRVAVQHSEDGFEFREERLLPETDGAHAKSSSLSLHDQLKSSETNVKEEQEKFGAPPSAEDQAYLASLHRQQRSAYEKQRRQALQDELDFSAAVASMATAGASQVGPTTSGAAARQSVKRDRSPVAAETDQTEQQRAEHKAQSEQDFAKDQGHARSTAMPPRFAASQLPSASAALGGRNKRPRAAQPAAKRAPSPQQRAAGCGLVQYGSSDDSN